MKTDKDEFKVSAIVSAYNSERFMRGRLQNLVEQTLFKENHLEIVVIDSNSPQNEGMIVEEYVKKYGNIRYVRTKERETVYGAWNRGIRLASGKYVINANTDDRFAVDGLEKMAHELESDENVHAVYGDWIVTRVENDDFDSRNEKFTFHYPEFFPPLLFYYQITSHALLIRREVFDRIGFYSEDLKVFGDREFMLRFSAEGLNARKLPDTVGLYLEDTDSLERSEKSAEAEFDRIREDYLMPEKLMRLFGYERIPQKAELARLYTYVGSMSFRFLSWNGEPASDLPFAGKVLKLSLKLDPSNITALNDLAILYCLSGNHEKGVNLLKEALALNTSDKDREDILSNLDLAERGIAAIEDYKWMKSEGMSPGNEGASAVSTFRNESDNERSMVSVIIPTCNRRDMLVEAIESVAGQTFKDFEIIVVNNGGEDVSDIIASFKDKCSIDCIELKTKKGPAAARNCGLKKAKGKYIAYLDDDDIYYPDHLEILVDLLERNGKGVVYSDSYQAFQKLVDNKYVTTEKKLVYSEDFDRQRLLVMNCIPTLNIVHGRNCIEDAGLFDEGLETHEDWDLWIRMSQRYDFHHIKAVTAEFRTRSNSSNSTSLKRPDFLETMKIIHARYAHLAEGPHILRQQKYIENELEREISFGEKNKLNSGHLSIVKTRKGVPSLRVKADNGTVKSLHSLYDPEKEAKSIVDAFTFDGKGMLVVLGLGLGYHVAELAEKFPEAEILVVEAVTDIYGLAIEHGPELDERIKFITGLSSGDVIRKITSHQIEKGFVPLSFFALSSEVLAFPDYYRPILESLKKTESVKIWERLRYTKFKEEHSKVLLIDSGYFLVQEMEKALRSLGHEVFKIEVQSPSVSFDNDYLVSEFIESILNYKPDFLLTMNHLGFDEEGALTSLLKSIEMPVASWYVDSPNLIVRGHDKNISPLISLFMWDKSYMKDMTDMGFESVQYLPLGTDETVFKPVTARKHRKKLQKYLCDVGFVGNSMVEPVDKYMSRLNEELHPLIEKVAGKLAETGKSYEHIEKMMQYDERMTVNRLSEKEKMDFEGAVIWKATLSYRLRSLEMLKGFNVSIHGDSAWKKLVKGKNIKLHPPLNYYKELSFFYNACTINFNATSRQMKKAVNQRVFDVPACEAFLLTDHQEALNDLFDVGNEIITYAHKDEIADIAGYYLTHPEQRKAVARKGRERVLKDHTYTHRVKCLITYMKERYK